MTQIKIFTETTYSNTSSAGRNVMTTERLAEKVNDFLAENDGKIKVKDIVRRTRTVRHIDPDSTLHL